jgi:hypothetical protein
MSELDNEMAALMARQAAKEMSANQSNLEEIARVLPRLPYDGSDLRMAREAVELWQRKGHNVALAPLGPWYHNATQEDRQQMQREWLANGLLFIAAGDYSVELVTVKVDAGRGFFGGQKVRYACYLSSGDGHYNPVGNVGSLALAITKISPVLRL